MDPLRTTKQLILYTQTHTERLLTCCAYCATTTALSVRVPPSGWTPEGVCVGHPSFPFSRRGRARSKGKFWICQVLQKAPGLLRTSRPNPTSTTARDGEVDEAVEPTNADDEAKPTTSHSADRSANSGGGETQGFFVFPLVFCLLT